MGLCSDQSIHYLRGLGYNVVRLPSESLAPLDLLARQNDTVEYIGGLEKLIVLPGSLPNVQRNLTAANVNGQSTSSFDLSFGLSVLNGMLAGLGGGKLGVELGFTDASKVSFQFTNVTIDRAAALDVSTFLKNGKVDAASPLLNQYVLGNGKLYVITEVLKSSEITAKFEKSKGVKAKVDVPVISGAVGGAVDAKHQGASDHVIKFKGTKQLAFGFKCFRIGVKDGVITMFAVKPGGVAVSVDEESSKGDILDEGLIDVVY